MKSPFRLNQKVSYSNDSPKTCRKIIKIHQPDLIFGSSWRFDIIDRTGTILTGCRDKDLEATPNANFGA